MSDRRYVSHFFCVSFYQGDMSWVPELSGGRYVVYAMAPVTQSCISADQIVHMPNVGYNIHSYCRYIVDHYDSLPDSIIFCKSNVFPRHVSRERFQTLIARNLFTPIEEPSTLRNVFPRAMLSSDNGYMEINNSWYARHHPLRYFGSFDDFYHFIFKDAAIPRYLRFAPGANYVVRRENILLRTRNFYRNLITFISHHQMAGEAHMVERALHAIWTSTVEESDLMTIYHPVSRFQTVNSANSTFVKRITERVNFAVMRAIDRML